MSTLFPSMSTTGRRTADPPAPREADRSSEKPGWWVPTILVVLVLVLLVGAYGISRVLSSSVEDTDVTAEVPDGVDIGGSASCEAASSVDSAGNPVSYGPQLA